MGDVEEIYAQNRLEEFERKIGYEFRKRECLVQAMMHTSCHSDRAYSYEVAYFKFIFQMCKDRCLNRG